MSQQIQVGHGDGYVTLVLVEDGQPVPTSRLGVCGALEFANALITAAGKAQQHEGTHDG